MTTFGASLGDALAKSKPHRPIPADAESVAQKCPERPDGVMLVRASDLTPEPISWLWRHWLALGKFHVLAGKAGEGKTTLALAMTATVTAGGRWPDGTHCPPANVLIWSGEDDPSDTLLPRLMAMGADVTRVFFIIGTRHAGEDKSFDPARDLVQLSTQAERIGGVKLLIVDPVVSVISGDSHRNAETRRGLQPLVDLGATLGVAVLGISHFSKGGAGKDPLERLNGSLAFGAVARVVMFAARVTDEGTNDRRLFGRAKSNIGPDDGGFEYALEQIEVAAGIEASRVTWGQPIAGTASEMLAIAEAQPDDEGSARNGAADFLRQVLGDDVVPSKTVQAEAKTAGVSWRTVERAAKDLSVVKRKGGMGQGWYWSLPKAATKTDTQNSWLSSSSSGGSWRSSEELAAFEDRQDRQGRQEIGVDTFGRPSAEGGES